MPSAEEQCQIVVLVRQIGYRSATTFNRLFERLHRVRSLQVSDNPRRVIVANFVPTVNTNLLRFAELQAHRRIMGFIGVIQSQTIEEQPSTSQNNCAFNNGEDKPGVYCSPSRRSSVVNSLTLSQIKEQYDAIKQEYSSMLVDSRCIAFGYSDSLLDELWSSREIFAFGCLEDADSLESGVREFLRSIFFVLESRRLDLSLEKLDPAPCPSVPDEQKYRMGVENKTSKIYRKKCLGRLRKQIADYTLLTGLPALAIDAYQASIDFLKQANDLLWLAAAYEGWACAAMTIKYRFGEECSPFGAIQRVSTMTADQMRCAQFNDQGHLGVTMGHQRHRSDVDHTSVDSAVAAQLSSEDHQRRSFRLPWTDRHLSGNSSLDANEIIEKFKMALENYERFSFAAWIEYECMMKAASVFRFQRLYIDMESFIRDHVGKYLDDSFVHFDHITKANICQNSAAVYRLIGFRRKCAFFSRLAVLFRLHITEGETRTSSDYRQVYPILYKTLVGYGIPENPKDIIGDLNILGPVQVQRRALHEVFMSALRAEHYDAAIRHLCYLLQVYYEYMGAETSQRMLDELARLVFSRDTVHQLNQHITLPQCGIIIPPIQMTRFPRLEKFAVCSLPAHLAPVVIRPQLKADIFIYSPFQNSNTSSKGAVYWVVDCACEVSVSVSNCLPFELSVNNLSLITEGCAFETVPVRLNLAPSADTCETVDIKLIGVPRAPGKLAITGYSCEVLGVRNVCRLRDLPTSVLSNHDNKQASVFDVEVLPPLPVLELQTSLPRAPISEEDMEPTAETTVYSGQIFEHTISIVNTSKTIAIRDVQLEINQPKVCGGPNLIQLSDDWFEDGGKSNENLTRRATNKRLRRLEPLERKQVKFRIFGIDPSATAEDGSSRDIRNFEGTDGISDEPLGENAHDRIPFTGRLLTSEFVFRYRADIDGPDNEQYERRCRLPLAVSILPAVTVAAWHVLPGDGPTTRYVVVDVTNSTEWEAELTYGRGKLINVQPKEICRVPLLCECCSEVASNAFHVAANRASHLMQMQEMERLRLILERHVSVHLDIRWSISACSLEGSVPAGPILSSVSLLKQLVVPAITVEMSVNGTPYLSEDDVIVGIGEVLNLEVRLISSLKEERSFNGILRLNCYRDLQNGSTVIISNENMIILNSECVPFSIFRELISKNELGSQFDTISIENDYAPSAAETDSLLADGRSDPSRLFLANFSIMFRCEGIYKVKPMLTLGDMSSIFLEEEIFCSAVSFSVITKVA